MKLRRLNQAMPFTLLGLMIISLGPALIRRPVFAQKSGIQRSGLDRSSGSQPYSKFKIAADYEFEFKTSSGLITDILTFPGGGKLIFNFPNNISAGETFSGTLQRLITGKDEKQRALNQAQLDNAAVLLGGQPLSVAGNIFTRTIPQQIDPRQSFIVVKVNGKEVCSAELPVSQTSAPPPPATTQLPTCGQMGQNVVVMDHCDGIIAPTDSCSIGNTTLQPLAESPRMRVSQNTSQVPGPTEIKYTEQGKETSGPFQNFAVELSAGELSLLRGQRTTLTVAAKGLAGIQQDVTFDLSNESPSVINMEGGNAQHLLIHPTEVRRDGTYQIQRVLNGIQQGAFSITATIVCPPPLQTPPVRIPTATPTPTPGAGEPPPLPSPGPDATPSACGPAALRTTYSIKDLGELPHPLSSFPSHCIATGVNDAGNVVGACQSKYAGGPASGSWHAFRTDAFDVIKPKDDLGFPVGVTGGTSFAMAVNAGGHVTGYWAGGSGEHKAFWHDGFMMINLHPADFPLKVSEAYALNKYDDVVGSAWSFFADKHAVIWPHGDHSMIDLNDYMDPSAKKDWKLIQAYGINDEEHIVGRAMHLKKLHAFLLKGKGAVPEDLGAIYEISDVDDASTAYGLNACDEVVGYTLDATLSYHGFLWNEDSGMTTTGTVPGYYYCYGQAINNKEEVVGTTSSKFHHSAIFEALGFSLGTDPKGVAYSHAIWYGGEKVKTLKDLNKFIPGFTGWELDLANGINDLGQIAGSGFYKAPTYKEGSLYSKAVLLTPTELVSKLGGPVGSKPSPPGFTVEYFTKLKVGAPVTFFVPFPSSIPCCVHVVKSGAPTIDGPITYKAYFYLLDDMDKPGANPYGTSISFSFDPTYITMPTGFKIPPGPKYGYFLFTTSKVTTPVTTSIKVKVIADKTKPGSGGEAETTITFTITPVP